MNIVALHTDFRIYWPARWAALARELERTGKGSLEVVEIFGKGSPYSFNKSKSDNSMKWHILYPDCSPEDKSGKHIKPDLFALLDKIDPDVIICGAIAFPSGALAVQWALNHHKKRVICFDDAKKDAVVRNKIVEFVKQNVYNGVDMMFYPAEPWRETGYRWGFKDEEIVFGIDVVDNDFWKRYPGHPLITPPYFLSVGRQIPVKNFMGVIKAYSIYVDNVGLSCSVPLVMVGEGPQHEELISEIKSLGLEKKIICLGFQSQENIRNLMYYSDLLLLLSKSETWGLVINEAMNCGCSILTTHECGASDVLVKDGVNGYVANFYNIDKIAEGLIKYHNLSEKEKARFSCNSKDIISSWGLDKFTTNAIRAAVYALSKPKRKPNYIGRLIIERWNGRYNPI